MQKKTSESSRRAPVFGLAEVGKRFTTVFVKFLWAFVRQYYNARNWRTIHEPFKKIYTVKDELNKRKMKERGDSEPNDSLADSNSETGRKDSKNLIHGY